MTLDRAITIHKHPQFPGPLYSDEEYITAKKLGIEALRWRRLMEREYGSWCGPLLPGETKE